MSFIMHQVHIVAAQMAPHSRHSNLPCIYRNASIQFSYVYVVRGDEACVFLISTTVLCFFVKDDVANDFISAIVWEKRLIVLDSDTTFLVLWAMLFFLHLTFRVLNSKKKRAPYAFKKQRLEIYTILFPSQSNDSISSRIEPHLPTRGCIHRAFSENQSSPSTQELLIFIIFFFLQLNCELLFSKTANLSVY